MCVGVKSRGLIEMDGGVSGCFWVGGCRKEGDGGGKLRKRKVEKQPDAERKDRDEHRWRLEGGGGVS